MKMVKSSNKRQLRQLVQTIVLAQGNVFIGQLLRDKGLRIGTTKVDFEQNLLTAIDDDVLTLGDVEQWLAEVEGWGDQHVYLFKAVPPDGASRLWEVPKLVQERLTPKQLKVWGQQSYELPEEWGLTGIGFEPGMLTFTWHRQTEHLVRKPKMDRREEIDGEQYQFKAHLERLDRHAMRFVLRADQGYAAVFMQTPAEGSGHKDALTLIRRETAAICDWPAMVLWSISDAMKHIDQRAINEGAQSKIIPHRTRFFDGGDYVEFGAVSETGRRTGSQSVRRVRNALRPGDFAGATGGFFFKSSLGKLVKVDLFGKEQRARLWAQLKADEVWEIVELLRTQPR